MRYTTTREDCAIEYTLKILGSKWTILVIRELFTGTKRFNELRRTLKTISTKTLVERLRELEEEGILTRTIYAEVPPRVEYALTERGLSLRPILRAMIEWGQVGDPAKGNA